MPREAIQPYIEDRLLEKEKEKTEKIMAELEKVMKAKKYLSE